MKHYLQDEFEAFVDEIRELVVKDYAKRYPDSKCPKISFDTGRKYWRIVRGGSVYGFVRKDDGAIFRAASWKAPQTKTKSAIRGYLHDADRLNCCSSIAIRYVQ